MASIDRRDSMPDSVADVWFDFNWDNQKVWKAEGSHFELEVSQVAWLLDLPIWRDMAEGRNWQVRPIEVLRTPASYPIHTQRIEEADLTWPVAAMPNRGRLVLLDGYHRLAKAVRQKTEVLPAKLLSESSIAEIARDQIGS